MKRLHTYQEYKVKIDLMHKIIPDISVTTDIITGFSGETEEDHQATMRALSEIHYDSAFIYKYSLRPGTPAGKLPDDVVREVKERRHEELLTLHRKIARAKSEQWIGKTVNVFCEEKSSKTPGHLIGRTDQDKRVVFVAGENLVNTFVRVTLKELHHETLFGVLA